MQIHEMGSTAVPETLSTRRILPAWPASDGKRAAAGASPTPPGPGSSAARRSPGRGQACNSTSSNTGGTSCGATSLNRHCCRARPMPCDKPATHGDTRQPLDARPAGDHGGPARPQPAQCDHPRRWHRPRRAITAARASQANTAPASQWRPTGFVQVNSAAESGSSPERRAGQAGPCSRATDRRRERAAPWSRAGSSQTCQLVRRFN